MPAARLNDWSTLSSADGVGCHSYGVRGFWAPGERERESAGLVGISAMQC